MLNQIQHDESFASIPPVDTPIDANNHPVYLSV